MEEQTKSASKLDRDQRAYEAKRAETEQLSIEKKRKAET
jgi:hypothetical protein